MRFPARNRRATRGADFDRERDGSSGQSPDDVQSKLKGDLQAYLKDVVAIDWPAMRQSHAARRFCLRPVGKAFAERDRLSSQQHVSTGSFGDHTPLLNQLLDIRHARLARLAAASMPASHGY